MFIIAEYICCSCWVHVHIIITLIIFSLLWLLHIIHLHFRLAMRSLLIFRAVLIMHPSLGLTWVVLPLMSPVLLGSMSMSLRVWQEVSPYKHHRYVYKNVSVYSLNYKHTMQLHLYSHCVGTVYSGLQWNFWKQTHPIMETSLGTIFTNILLYIANYAAGSSFFCN